MDKRKDFLNWVRNKKLTDELIDQAYQLAKEGQYDTVIFNILGITSGTWYRWMKDGKRFLENPDAHAEQPYSEEMKRLMARFYYMVRLGQAEAEQRAVNIVQKASINDWKAAAWYLERKYRERWGRTIITVEGDERSSKLDEFVSAMQKVTQLSEEERAAVEAELTEDDE